MKVKESNHYNQLHKSALNISDEEILSMLKNGQNVEKGFKLLMLKYQERLYWQIRRLVLEHEDANDVIQNTFIKVFRNIQKFKGDSKLYTWMYRIATNEAITFLKKKQKKTTTSIDSEELNIANRLKADVYFDGDEAQIRLQQALVSLPEKQRLVFNMRYFEEKSYQEISDILGTTVGGLKASYHHAVKKIELHIKEVES